MKQLLLLFAISMAISPLFAQFTFGGSLGYSVKGKSPTAGAFVGYKEGPLSLESGFVAHVPSALGTFFQQIAGIEVGHISLYSGASYHLFNTDHNREQPPNGWWLMGGIKYKHVIRLQECWSCEEDDSGYWGVNLQRDGKYTIANLLIGVHF